MSQKGIEMALIYLIEKEKERAVSEKTNQYFGCTWKNETARQNGMKEIVDRVSKPFDKILRELRS